VVAEAPHYLHQSNNLSAHRARGNRDRDAIPRVPDECGIEDGRAVAYDDAPNGLHDCRDLAVAVTLPQSGKEDIGVSTYRCGIRGH
jgi:hypothetical protein